MAMKRSWQIAARRHPGGWAIALATAALVLAPGVFGIPPAAAHFKKIERHDVRGQARGHGDAAGASGSAWHDGRVEHHRGDTFTFEGGKIVPRSQYKAHFQVRRDERARDEGRHHRHHYRHHGRSVRLSVENAGTTTWEGPVILVLDWVGGRDRVHHACGHLPTGEPFICLMRSGTWAPGDMTPKVEMHFRSGRWAPFRWHLEAMPVAAGDPPNQTPVADAGADQTAFVGDTVTLDGAASSDADGDPLTFSWTLDSAPAGSGAALSDVGAVNPTLAIDAPGLYVLSLAVDDGLATSAPDTVQVSTLNSPPVASAGPDHSGFVGDTVTLDGTGSSDVDGDPLTFSWSIASAPFGSAAALDDPEAMLPSFTIDKAGTYELDLVVSDPLDDSVPDTVLVTTLNSAPRADAGPDQTVPLGSAVALDGSGSLDVDGDAMSFAWSLTTVPPGSGATLDDPAAEAPGFTADVAGTYVAQLVVSDGALDSAPDTVVVDTSNTRPVANAGLDMALIAGNPAVLGGGGSFDPDGDAISFFWAITSAPAGSTAALDNPAAVTPSFTPDVDGDYLVQLIVSDGTLDSTADTVLMTALVPPVLAVGDASVKEGNAGTTPLAFTVFRLGTLVGDVSVDYATASLSATSDVDFAATSGTLVIPSGAPSATVTVDVLGDTLEEGDETFALNLSAPMSAALADPQGIGTILGDDIPALSVVDVAVVEGDAGPSPATLMVNFVGPLPLTAIIQYATSDGTATAGSDYVATTGVLVIPAGLSSGGFNVSVLGDRLVEGDETVFVTLTSAVYTTGAPIPIADGQGTLTILDNDGPPP